MARSTPKTITPAPAQMVEVVAPAVVPPVDESAQKAKKSKKAKKEDVVDAPAPVVDSAPKEIKEVVNEVVMDSAVVDTPPAPVVESPFTLASQRLIEFGKHLQDISVQLATLKVEYKAVEKVISKEFKVANKHFSKGKKSGIKREPTGFVKPTLISDELAQFLNKESGIELARMTVSKEIHNYIKSNGLNKGRFIYPDAPLAKILNNYKEGQDPPVSYLNLQRYLKHHFIGNKVVPPVEA